MSVTLELSPEIEAILRRLAQEKNQDVDSVARELLERVVKDADASRDIGPDARPFWATATPAEWSARLHALGQSAARIPNVPVLPPEAFEPESLYEDERVLY